MAEKTIESLLENSPAKAGLRTIYKKEWEYADVLGPMEFAIACHYLEAGRP